MLGKTVLLPTTGGCEVELDLYVPPTVMEVDPQPRRPAILICPGGGYSHMGQRESYPVAIRFIAHGFNCFVIKYRFAPYRFPAPQHDAALAMAYIRRHAEELYTDPDRIAVMGFSAGGHLAGSLGVMWQEAALWREAGLTPEEVRPNALVLCYAVLLGSGEFAEGGSYRNLTGSDDPAVHERAGVVERVTDKCPPAFMWHTFDDTVVPVENSLLMAKALSRCKVTTELHVFPKGSHGSSLCNEQVSGTANPQYALPDCDMWPEMAAKFLKKYM